MELHEAMSYQSHVAGVPVVAWMNTLESIAYRIQANAGGPGTPSAEPVAQTEGAEIRDPYEGQDISEEACRGEARRVSIVLRKKGHYVAANLLLHFAAQTLAVPDAIVELDDCRKRGWNDSAPAYRSGWNDCRDAYFAAQRDASRVNQAALRPGESA
jgi:hypothetical protein